ncbi:hypothetical protein B0H11DRAFT_2204805 [Mycena galericulata]|nr:hypothetical protein B0H11DRAFT_2204805 [Mycena galericulata]
MAGSGYVLLLLSMNIDVEYATTKLQPGLHRPSRLEMTRGFENFVSIFGINYYLKLSGQTDKSPSGYLFLCPRAELQSEDPTSFQFPDFRAYWSLDPSGVRRLTDEEAEDWGFQPSSCKSKGFDPYSQEVAQERTPDYPYGGRIRNSGYISFLSELLSDVCSKILSEFRI